MENDNADTKVKPNVSVRIPTVIAAKYRLQVGDALEVRDFDGCIVFIPEHAKKNAKFRKKANAFLWDLMEREAEEDIKAGRVSGPFATVEELLKDLRQ
jgi:hypothetical protein